MKIERLVLECHLIDYGPGGLLGAQRDVVYGELGLATPRMTTEHAREAVRTALRDFRVPQRLSSGELARGRTPSERAASVRALIEAACHETFGETEDERLLRRVLARGYLDPTTGHEQAAADLHLSRAAYFRRLRTGCERIADYLAVAAPRRFAEHRTGE